MVNELEQVKCNLPITIISYLVNCSYDKIHDFCFSDSYGLGRSVFDNEDQYNQDIKSLKEKKFTLNIRTFFETSTFFEEHQLQ